MSMSEWRTGRTYAFVTVRISVMHRPNLTRGNFGKLIGQFFLAAPLPHLLPASPECTPTQRRLQCRQDPWRL